MSIENLHKVVEEIKKFLDETYSKYVHDVDRVSKLWDDYRKEVGKLKSSWDKDSIMVYSRLANLRDKINIIKDMIDVVKAKRDLEMIDENSYVNIMMTLNDLLERITSLYNDMKRRFEDIDLKVKEHWIRALEVEPASAEKIDNVLKEIERDRSADEIDEETYSRLMRDLEIVKRVSEIVSLLRGRSQHAPS